MTTSPIEAIRALKEWLPDLMRDKEFLARASGRMTVDDWENFIAALEAATLSQPAVVDGWKLVPIEPTEEMLEEGENARLTKIENSLKVKFGFADDLSAYAEIWRDMLAAAPSPAIPERPTDEFVRGLEAAAHKVEIYAAPGSGAAPELVFVCQQLSRHIRALSHAPASKGPDKP